MTPARPLVRYVLFQIPGWVIVTLVAVALWHATGAGLLAVALVVVWVVKDALLYPLVRASYDTRTPTGVAALVGRHGVARDDLNPEGYVRVWGELWRARLAPGETAISRGTPIEVDGTDGSVLLVRRSAEARGPLARGVEGL